MAEASRELIAEEKVELPDIRYNHLNCPKNGNCGDVPPIKEWEKRLVGKRLIKEDEEGDETTFKRSGLPQPYKMLQFSDFGMRRRDRLNVDVDTKTMIVRGVWYG